MTAPFTADPAFARRVLAANAKLRDAVSSLEFGEPVTHVTNPLDYAWDLHAAWVRRWGASPRRVLMMGMNPGPWGMAQTGVPFGEVTFVQNWLGLEGAVRVPAGAHPKRPVQGLACPRSEVSGRRLWGHFAERFGRAEDFFTEHFVVNYCPLVFCEETGRNRTPDKLPAVEVAPLFAACDRRLAILVDLYRPEWVVGVGGFAQRKLAEVLKGQSDPPRQGKLLHPSPASPAANRGWAEAATRQLTDQEIW